MRSANSIAGEELVANEDDAPLDTVVVYQSETSNVCGHSFKMVSFIDYLVSDHKKAICPVCQGQIEVVCDGMVSRVLSTHVQSDDSSSLNSINEVKLVKFKHRNHLYQLTVLNINPNMHVPQSWFSWIWYAMLRFVGEDAHFTAQDRIASVLRLDMASGMRVSTMP